MILLRKLMKIDRRASECEFRSCLNKLFPCGPLFRRNSCGQEFACRAAGALIDRASGEPPSFTGFDGAQKHQGEKKYENTEGKTGLI